MDRIRNGYTDVCDKLMLDAVRPGHLVRVVSIPESPKVRGRLANLGIGSGSELVVQTVYPFKGPVVVRLEGRTIAIGRGLARKIEVEKIQDLPSVDTSQLLEDLE